MAEDRPAEPEGVGSETESYEQIAHHAAPVQPGGEADYGPVEPESVQTGRVDGELEPAEPRDRERGGHVRARAQRG